MADTIRKNVDVNLLGYYDGKIKNYINNKVGTGGLTIDSELSSTSENPVQNKVINSALEEKASKDDIPVEMTGATSSSAGTSGLVPAPVSGEQDKFLKGDGTWTAITPTALGMGYATCSTASATTAKVVSLSNYTLTTGGIIAIKFTYAVPANATLNINSKGAKSIYYRGSAITAGIINAGDIGLFVFSGSYYRLIAVNSAISKLASTSYTTITINTSDWTTNSDGGYMYEYTLPTAMPYDNFNFDIVLSTDQAAAKLQIEAWNCIIADGNITQTTSSSSTTAFTFYAFTTQPSVALTIGIQGVS